MKGQFNMNEIQWAFLGGIAVTVLFIIMSIIVVLMIRVWKDIEKELQQDKIKHMQIKMIQALQEQTDVPKWLCELTLSQNDWNMEKARKEIEFYCTH